MERKRCKKAETAPKDLMGLVFSWSLKDILNKNLYKDKVKMIPDTFLSVSHYLTSFIYPLIEETHADLLSSMTMVSQAPLCEILSVETTKDYEPPTNLKYKITVKGIRNNGNDAEIYEPETGDLIALIDVRPKCISDLNRPKRSYIVASVVAKPVRDPDEPPPEEDTCTVLSSKPIEFEQNMETNKKRETLFAVFLINMTTNNRIWAALNIGPDLGNKSIIQKVLQPDSLAGEECTLCSSDSVSNSEPMVSSFDLNDSQKAAVLSCIAARECHHQNSIKQIWGPPGTGKTKTVATLLFALYRMKCRTVTCAPTNIAVLTVTERLVGLVRDSNEYGTYGLGDILLFGNGKRMKIDDHRDLHDVFLDFRAKILANCFSPRSGWKHSLESMICLLEDPKEMYSTYLRERTNQGKGVQTDQEKEEDIQSQSFDKDGRKNKKSWMRKDIERTLKNSKKGKGKKQQDKNSEGATDGSCDKLLTLEEFFKKKFYDIVNNLKFCIPKLRTHLPTSLIPLEVEKNMIGAHRLLESFITLFQNVSVESKGLKEVIEKLEMQEKVLIASNATLLFCTASSSAKIPVGGKPIELLVIDEAAQLKECESAIPLQISGIRHAILIGDELQLPAMVKSKISEEAKFGRSLFQRLVLLGHRKHLLNLQYRMHPSISLFPNREFYDNLILDAPNVKERKYERSYLHGNMYGSYSFINVAYGKEEFDNRLSRSKPLQSLLEHSIPIVHHGKQRVSVGIISPYKAQVYAIQDRLGKKYTSSADGKFSVSVRSVDGFQGGEEDIIIISTVRCNLKGSVGFISNRQRTNVALTRARYCLWIFGNGPTLEHSGTVWRKLVNDAKDRGCFHNAEEDNNLARAITTSLVELGELHLLQKKDSLLFRKARWKVHLSDDFWKSMVRIKSVEIHNKVFCLLEKLSSGWRRPDNEANPNTINGTCSQLLEQYKVTNILNLVWSVEILKEDSNYIQVLKVWDILPMERTPKQAARLEILFGNKRVIDMDHCKFKCVEGNLEVPMTWPADDEPEQSLSSFKSLSLQS
ncbi:putative helicase MAGATAMA 3 [Vitis vinifera]|uniref:Putative helicase MAGATAMA 3 n=1 Tax=Vitis vinifera TaxID=29760 RepID=A0A438ID67_VITVI|nr:putative helicase MAGATAMA 3 [Vitis vinifera]